MAPCAFANVATTCAAFASAAIGVAGHELHLGYSYLEATPLMRSPKRPRKHRKMVNPRVQMAVGVSGATYMDKYINVTTQLEDMTSEYTGMIGVGTNKEGQPVFNARVVFDTGSTNLWVASVLCTDYPCTEAKSKHFYDPNKSITKEEFIDSSGKSTAGKDIDIQFGTGELRGPLQVDTYRVGPMHVLKQPFAMIREMNGEVFTSFPFEGILGLAFKSLSFGGIEPFFERVIKQKLLERNEFAFYLNADSSKPSAILWGGVDKSLYHGSIHMFPVAQAHYWALELVDFTIGGESVLTNDENRVTKLIVDTGTTYFTAPSGTFDTIVGHMKDAPCREVDSYPDMTFKLKGVDGEPYDLVVTQKTYMIGEEEGDCRPAFMELNINNKYGPAMILGEVFMRHFFTVFHRGNGDDASARVGFAPANVGANPNLLNSKASLTSASFLQGAEAMAPPLVRREREMPVRLKL